MRRLAMLAAAMALIIPVAAQAMTFDQFLARANALKAQGMMAMLSSDVAVLKGEMAEALKAWQDEKAARKAAGKPPLACAPEGTKMSRDEMLDALAALPAAQRAGSLKYGVGRVFIARYPCR